MFKGWMTNIGISITSVGAFLTQIPQDLVIGSKNGQPITVGHITTVVGIIIAAFGFTRKVATIEDKVTTINSNEGIVTSGKKPITK